MAKKLSYESAVDYIEDSGVSCSPCCCVGDYACNLLDSEADEDGKYTIDVLKDIVRRVKRFKKELEEE